jgi:hypothetical protein
MGDPAQRIGGIRIGIGTGTGNSDGDSSGNGDRHSSFIGPTGLSLSNGGFVYCGHTATMTCAKFLPSGTYAASGDPRGLLWIWLYHQEKPQAGRAGPGWAGKGRVLGPRGDAGRRVWGR